MKRVLIAAAALLAFVSPAWALTQDEAQQMVTSTGCTATVYVHDIDNFNAYYNGIGDQIVLLGLGKLPETWQRHILWHEVGHCLQFQSGRWQKLINEDHGLEWDADAFAIDQMAKEGVDGAQINEDVWAWAYQEDGWEGLEASPHGTSVDRITRGNLNRRIKRIET